eukprot:761540-Hanusia_phi.AAC.3
MSGNPSNSSLTSRETERGRASIGEGGRRSLEVVRPRNSIEVEGGRRSLEVVRGFRSSLDKKSVELSRSGRVSSEIETERTSFEKIVRKSIEVARCSLEVMRPSFDIDVGSSCRPFLSHLHAGQHEQAGEENRDGVFSQSCSKSGVMSGCRQALFFFFSDARKNAIPEETSGRWRGLRRRRTEERKDRNHEQGEHEDSLISSPSLARDSEIVNAVRSKEERGKRRSVPKERLKEAIHIVQNLPPRYTSSALSEFISLDFLSRCMSA